MTEPNRVKDPLGHYAELQRKASPHEPMSDAGVAGRVLLLLAGGVLAAGAIVYGLFF
jgi:hypothetical protein